MRAAKPPANETERLAALERYAILDTLPELAYDEIVKLAAHICGAPIALVSLVDRDRQWFKARIGLDAEQTDREVSFCAHVVEQGQMLVVEDAREDPRFADNPLVLGEPNVVFYAGAPLDTDEGYTLGSLCVIDHQPRSLSPAQFDMLHSLSRVVIRQLDMRRSELARAQALAEAEAAHARANRARALRQKFFEVSLDLLCVAGFDGYFKEVNPIWTKVLGWTSEELCARPFIEFVHPDDREKTIAEAAALGGGDHLTISFVNRCATKSGDYRWLDWSATADTQNQVLLAAARDITQAKAHERELIAARQLAEQANTAKSEFLAKMSHELRTPLNSVIGFTNLLRKNKAGTLNTKDLLYLEKIGKNSVHLLSLINDLLDLSKIEAGRTELELGPVPLAELCANVYDELEGAVASEGNHLHVRVPEGLTPIHADPRRFKQILINLIGNANKFTNGGIIELRVCASEDDPHEVARIDVVDSGIGIDPDQVELVFEAFRQASEGGARTHGGTGLGLAISRSLAQLHGFELGVVSVVGQGSTFYVCVHPDAPIPRHRPPTPGTTPQPRLQPQPASRTDELPPLVLLIEDDSDARLLVAKAIEQVGGRVATADSGSSGLAIARALTPNLIVLDLGLPDMHGRELVNRLSEDPQLRHIPVVIHSADGQGARGVRTAAVLEKPVSLDELAQTLAKHLGPRRRALVVDDDSDTRVVLRSMLGGLGFDSLEAADGVEALATLREHEVDMVLLDICMPRMSGIELLERIRQDPELSHTPVVICTALDLEPSQTLEVASGSQGLIRKGFNLEGRIEEIIHKLFRESAP